MAQFQFTITAGSIATGDPAADVTVVADRGLSRSATPRILVAKFGDGYEQRVADGVNPSDQNFSITFNNREAAKIYEIAAFFDAQTGKAFDLVVTDHSGDTTVKVVCEEYGITYISELFHSMSASFRRVYEP
jgi:phage-related protein